MRRHPPQIQDGAKARGIDLDALEGKGEDYDSARAHPGLNRKSRAVAANAIAKACLYSRCMQSVSQGRIKVLH
jgi:hypothetical protein